MNNEVKYCEGCQREGVFCGGTYCVNCQPVSYGSLIDVLKNQIDKANQFQAELTTERETTQQAIQTSQEWHERQKQEIIAEWTSKYQNLVNKWKSTIQQEITLIKEILAHDQ